MILQKMSTVYDSNVSIKGFCWQLTGTRLVSVAWLSLNKSGGQSFDWQIISIFLHKHCPGGDKMFGVVIHGGCRTVPGGSLDGRQRSDCGLHQKRGRHTIVHTDADDDTPAQVVRLQGDHVGSRPSARSAQHPGGFAVQSGPDTEHRENV